MITDLHNHTFFSYDSSDLPEKVIENAKNSGIDLIGITDHQFTPGFDILKYATYIEAMKEKYKNTIKVKTGLEIGTRPKPSNLMAKTASKVLDYCLFESLDSETAMDLWEFLAWRRSFSCPVGFAHTDIFKLSKKYDVDIFKIMKEENIFWEINTSGNYVYYYDFITNKNKQEAVKKSGITLSVGSDTHSANDRNINKLISCHNLCETLGNPMLFKEV